MTELILYTKPAIYGATHVPEPKYPKLLLLPAEIRLKIFAIYLQLETAHNDSTLATHRHLRQEKPCCDVFETYLKNARNDSTLAKQLHVDKYNNPCCTWRWPDDLIICDRSADAELPVATIAPWLPALALTNKQLLSEITIFMLSTTEWFDFKEDPKKPFKIARWFTDLLSTFPTVVIDGVATTEAFAATKRINFPHTKYHVEKRNIDEDNHDVSLMLKCAHLETIAMSFHWAQLMDWGASAFTDDLRPLDLDAFLDRFHFRPMLEHEGVENVYLEGVHHVNGERGQLACLYEFGRWLVKGYRSRGREVNVYISKRGTRFKGRTVGQKVVVEEEDAVKKDRRKSV